MVSVAASPLDDSAAGGSSRRLSGAAARAGVLTGRGSLGPLIVVTDAAQAAAPLPEVIEAAVRGGARAVLLRDKQLPRDERVALAASLRQVLEPVGGLLIVAGADPLGGRAVHLAASDDAVAQSAGSAGLGGLNGRPAAGHEVCGSTGHITDRVITRSVMWDWVGRSCHGEAEIKRLSTEDYAFVSPIFPTPSKPGYGPPLGLDGLSRLCAVADRPVYALGGIRTRQQAAECIAAGSAGIAVMGEIMRAAAPANTVAELLAGLPGATVAA